MRGLNWQKLAIPLAAGLNQKGDARAGDPPALDICTDAMFDEIGGLQTRYPFSAITNSIFGGGTLSNCRKLAVNGDELLCFTKESLYSWSPQRSAWVLKGTHLAAEIEERTAFATTGDQMDCDRAELSGTIVYAWLETTASGSVVYVAARDKTTGAIVMSPTAIVGSETRPRLVALSTKILLFTKAPVGATTEGLVVRAIDPASPATGVASVATQIMTDATYNDRYDVVRIVGADQAIGVARRDTTTSYEVFKVTAGLVVTQSTKARESTGSMAIACSPTGTQAMVIRYNTTATQTQCDLLTISTLADVNINTVLTGISDAGHYAAAFRSTQDSGQYRCYVIRGDIAGVTWTFDGTGSAINWVDTGANVGSVATMPTYAASRAFSYDGRVYVWGVYDDVSGSVGTVANSLYGRAQSSLFLMRDDGLIIAKALMNRGASRTTAGLLPEVALVDGTTTFAFCATERRKIELSNDLAFALTTEGYAARAPRDVLVTFDSNAARRAARIGETLYVTGGEIMQYDGRGLVECGFHVTPALFQANTGAAGSIPDGTYAYQLGYSWLNARGELERCFGIAGAVEFSGGPFKLRFDSVNGTLITHKGAAISVEVWRSAIDPTDTAALYLVSSQDPAATGDNEYIQNTTTGGLLPDFYDNFTDTELTSKEAAPDPSILESLAPPAATIILANESRVFLAGVAGDPDRVWYSKLRGIGEIVSFHDALTIDVPIAGGAITGLAFLNETLIVFRESAIYAFPGDGFANDASGTNYGPARTLSIDIGASSADSIASIAPGLIFKSSKGWYVLNRGWGLDYVGAPVCDYDDETPLSAHVLTSKHQVRIVTASRMLVWDYLANQWGTWTITDGLDAAVWSGTYHYLTSTGPKAEQTSYATANYGMDIETAWIKLDTLQGFGRVRRIHLLGEYRSAHWLRVRIARDYKATATDVWDYFDDQGWEVTPTTTGGPMQLRIGPSQQQCQAIKIRISVVGEQTPATYASELTSGQEGDTFTTFRATSLIAGTIANGRTVQLVNTGTGSGTWIDGTAAVFRYESGVTTVTDLIAASAGSAYFEIDTPFGVTGPLNRNLTITVSGAVDDSYAAPSGECLKLTGIGLEIGIKRGPYQMLPSTQKI